jgi:hypothetical protein
MLELEVEQVRQHTGEYSFDQDSHACTIAEAGIASLTAVNAEALNGAHEDNLDG